MCVYIEKGGRRKETLRGRQEEHDQVIVSGVLHGEGPAPMRGTPLLMRI